MSFRNPGNHDVAPTNWKSAALALAITLTVMACADVPTQPAIRMGSTSPASLALGAEVDQSSGSDVSEDHVNACGQSIDLVGTLQYAVRVVTDGHGGWHREIMLLENLSGIAQPSGATYTGSIRIYETSELPGGDSDDSWPFTHTFHRQVKLGSATAPDITVDRTYHVTGTPDQRIVIERNSRVERCR